MSKLIKAIQASFNNHNQSILLTLKKNFVYERYTYWQIKDYTLRFSTFLKNQKLSKGDKIAICSYNCPQYFYTFLGAMFSGIILVPIDYGSSPELINKFMQITQCKLIITSKFKIFDTKVKKVFVEDLTYDITNLGKTMPNKNIKANDLVEIVFTSGTTGNPKGVMLR